MKIETRLDRGRINHEAPGDVHLMVSVAAPEVEEAKRKPIDVVIALDISSSMSDPATAASPTPTKLELAKVAARRFVENLDRRDRVGIVVYSTEVTVLAPIVELTEAQRLRLIEQISQLQPIANTDLTGGCLRSLALLTEEPASEGRVRRVILFTDGLPTVEPRKYPDVMMAIRARLDGKTPITTIGFGAKIVEDGAGSGGYDPELLTSIARESGGNFYHAESADGILETFALELGALRSVAATDVRLEVRTGAGIRVKEVLNDFTVRTEDNGVVTVTIGQLYSGERQDVVIALEVPVRDTAFPRDTLAASVRFTGVETKGGAFDLTEEAKFRYVEASEADQQPDQAVEEQRLRLKAAQAIADAYRYAARGDYQRAVTRVREVRMLLMRFGSRESQIIVAVLQKIEVDVGDAQRFAQRGASVRAAAGSTAMRRTGSDRSSDYYDGKHSSVQQLRSQQDMGSDKSGSGGSQQRPSGAHGGNGPSPSGSQPSQSSRPASDAIPKPAGPDKTSSRNRL